MRIRNKIAGTPERLASRFWADLRRRLHTYWPRSLKAHE